MLVESGIADSLEKFYLLGFLIVSVRCNCSFLRTVSTPKVAHRAFRITSVKRGMLGNKRLKVFYSSCTSCLRGDNLEIRIYLLLINKLPVFLILRI